MTPTITLATWFPYNNSSSLPPPPPSITNTHSCTQNDANHNSDLPTPSPLVIAATELANSKLPSPDVAELMRRDVIRLQQKVNISAYLTSSLSISIPCYIYISSYPLLSLHLYKQPFKHKVINSTPLHLYTSLSWISLLATI